MARFRYAALLVFISLCGCASHIQPFPGECATRDREIPALKIWSNDQQARLAKEVKALPQGSILIDAMIDYKRMRDELRRE